jgi:dihydroorotase
MALEKFDGIELPATADFHVHLRDGEMMKLVTPTIRQGGVNTVFVMVRNSHEFRKYMLML